VDDDLQRKRRFAICFCSGRVRSPARFLRGIWLKKGKPCANSLLPSYFVSVDGQISAIVASSVQREQMIILDCGDEAEAL
jgi:hypothetical protein